MHYVYTYSLYYKVKHGKYSKTDKKYYEDFKRKLF